MKKEDAVIYLRVSTDEQVRGVGLLVQEKAVRQYIKRSGLKLKTIYKDEGVSGSTITERTGLLSLIEDMELGKIQHVVVYNVDRLSRNLDDLRMLRRLCLEQGVSLHSMNGKIDFATVEGNLFFNITGLMAETEMLQIRQRTRDALALKKVMHKRTGGIPFGFYVRAGNSLVKKTSEQRTIEFVNKKWRNGYTLAQICIELRQRKFVSRAGKNFVSQQVKRMLEYAATQG